MQATHQRVPPAEFLIEFGVRRAQRRKRRILVVLRHLHDLVQEVLDRVVIAGGGFWIAHRGSIG